MNRALLHPVALALQRAKWSPDDCCYRSEPSADPTVHQIYAMTDAFVDFLVEAGPTRTGELVFRLNDTELTLETFRLQQEQLLADITAARLSDDYVNKLVYGPLRAAIEFAEADLAAAESETKAIERDRKFFGVNIFDPEVQEMIGAVGERTALLAQARADLLQRQIEIDGQRRRLRAEQEDLAQRLALNDKLREIHEYALPADGVVEMWTFNGAFVHKGDPICLVHFHQRLQL